MEQDARPQRDTIPAKSLPYSKSSYEHASRRPLINLEADENGSSATITIKAMEPFPHPTDHVAFENDPFLTFPHQRAVDFKNAKASNNHRQVLERQALNEISRNIPRPTGLPSRAKWTSVRSDVKQSKQTADRSEIGETSPRRLLWPTATKQPANLHKHPVSRRPQSLKSYHMLDGLYSNLSAVYEDNHDHLPHSSTFKLHHKESALLQSPDLPKSGSVSFAAVHRRSKPQSQLFDTPKLGGMIQSPKLHTSNTVNGKRSLVEDDSPETNENSTTQPSYLPSELASTVDALPHSGPAAATSTSHRQKSKENNLNMRFRAARRLPAWEVWSFRILFAAFVILANISLLLAYFHTSRHLYLLAILAFMKSKDLLSTFVDVVGSVMKLVKRLFRQPVDVSPRWILSLVCAYAESEEQIMKTVTSLAEQDIKPHKQVICIVLDGKNPAILPRFTKVLEELERSYFTWKGGTGNLLLYSGYIRQIPVILIRKMRNAGKKDSLILGHDLFNYPRSDMPHKTRCLRKDVFRHFIPTLTGRNDLEKFDFIFCTDADSTIHQHALRELSNALCRNNRAIAACGVLVAELSDPKMEWSSWHLYQQFQYTFGQYVRRQAEGIWGRVTCLPGCITMIATREEMGPAISLYAEPVTSHNIFEHQVQYLGTDRRLTYCILTQSKSLKTLFIPTALCETVVPNSLEHYLSQRRRWASNAYFNDYYYAGGKNQYLITRLFALIDVVRQTLVFYRVINTGLFLYSLVTRFYILKIVPTLILTKTPVTWFMLMALTHEDTLRYRLHKLFLGMCINQVISPFLSVVVFANVLLNMGNQVWGTTGVSSVDTRSEVAHYVAAAPVPPIWSPTRLGNLVKSAVRDLRPQQKGSGSTRRSNGDPPMNEQRSIGAQPSFVIPRTKLE